MAAVAMMGMTMVVMIVMMMRFAGHGAALF